MSAAGFTRPSPRRSFAPDFIDREQAETAARAAMRVESPWLAKLLSASPTVRYADEPVAARPAEPLGLTDAVECALQVCDVLARLHGERWVGLGTAAADIRVTRDGDAWRATVVVPHLPSEGRESYDDAWRWFRDDAGPVSADLAAVVGLLRDLLDGHVPTPFQWWNDSNDYVRRPLSAFTPTAVHATLVAVLAGEARDGLPADAASLALALSELARDPDAWRARIETLPKARPRELHHDWVRLTALGELALAERPGDAYTLLPLAAAWHQRACKALAESNLDAAERCVARALALDPWCRYLVTQGCIREARGDLAGAALAFERAVEPLRRPEPDELTLQRWNEPHEAARALYARGVTRYRLGDLAGAREDLREAEACLLDEEFDLVTGLRRRTVAPSPLRALIRRALQAERFTIAPDEGAAR